MLISLSLTALLIVFLFSFFVQNAKIENKLDTARMSAIRRGYLQTRLQTVFTSIHRGTNESFYTKTFDKDKQPSLVVQFDNGIDPEAAFSGTILGKIFIDKDKNLCLTTSPIDEEENPQRRTEVLCPNVNDFEFAFLGNNGASEHGSKEKRIVINANYAWRSEWSKSMRGIPGIIRLTLHEEGREEPLRYAFILPITACIQYKGKNGT